MQAATAATFAALTGHGLVMVKYWAEWCHPCHLIAPTLQRLEATVTGLKVVTVNADEFRDMAKAQGVRAIPALHLYRDGVLVGTRTGVATEAEIRAHFKL